MVKVTKEQVLKSINTVAPDTKMDDNVAGWIGDIDFIEIIMEIETQYNCSIDEGPDITIESFEKVSDMVDWLEKKSNENKDSSK